MADDAPKPFSPAQERIADVFVRLLSVSNTWLFRASGGRLGNRFLRGAPVLLLTTVGARTGHRRTTPLIYAEHGDEILLVASKGGMTHHPAWYHNLVKNPQADVQIGSDVRRMTARRASDEEKSLLWPRLLEVYPDYDGYQARTERDIPVMVLSRS